jgi:N-acetylglucosaminyldiphosphoundecaprenol N-acetyl-beta-D-mannosaminyltransferase
VMLEPPLPVSISGIRIFNESLNGLVNDILNQKVVSHVHLAAASTITEASVDRRLHQILNNGITICDSKPLSRWLKLKGYKIEQIRGTDLLRQVLKESNRNCKHYFLGGTEQTISKLINKIEGDYPNCSIVGFYSPPFSIPSTEEIERWSERIAASNANIVWVGLGSPKQDFVAHDLALVTGKTVIAVGAAFDFLAGTVSEAPRATQALGLEWLYRLYSEPKRLWRRYTIGNVKFMMLLLRDILNR